MTNPNRQRSEDRERGTPPPPPSPESWEARMAERHRQRERRKHQDINDFADKRVAQKYNDSKDRPWLNGWSREDLCSVRIGAGSQCVCCGRSIGITCTVFDPDWEPPGPEPLWPFTSDDCPLCLREDR